MENEKELSEASKIRFIPLGGGNENTASSFLFSFDDIHILVDCGVRYNSELRYPDYSYLTRLLGSWGKLSAVFVTHSHMDHCGSLLRVLQEIPSEKIFMTEPTQEILVKLFRYQLKYESESVDDETTKQEIQILKTELFNEKIKDISIIDYYRPLTYVSPTIKKKLEIIPVPSGHMLGSCGFLMNYDEKEIFFTSDYQPQQQYSVGVKSFYPNLKSLNCLIIDGTNFYSLDKLLPSEKKDQEKYILEYVRRAIENHQFIIFPVNSTGHAQEIIKILDNAMLSDRIGKVPIYVDGSVNIVHKIYEKHFRKSKISFCSSNISMLEKNLQIQDVLFSSSVIVTTPKNFLVPESRSFKYASYIAENNLPHLIMSLFDPATPSSSRYSKDPHELLIQLNVVPYRLETHISANDIVSLLRKTNPKQVILVHSPIRRYISDKFKEIHPIKFPKDVSICQSINNMPIYI